MFETETEIAELQRMFDASQARANSHMRTIPQLVIGTPGQGPKAHWYPTAPPVGGGYLRQASEVTTGGDSAVEAQSGTGACPDGKATTRPRPNGRTKATVTG
jgi:hypothetical protein